MAGKRFHSRNDAKRRGDSLPRRLCVVARRGVTLVELLISVLILTIVCIAWMQIIGIQSARKEARRREAVERLAGMMDAFLYYHRNTTSFSSPSYYSVATNNNNQIVVASRNNNSDVVPLFDGDVSPVGYQLSVVTKANLPNSAGFGNSWGSCKWLVGKLYNRSDCTTNDAGRPFFTLPVCLGQ